MHREGEYMGTLCVQPPKFFYKLKTVLINKSLSEKIKQNKTK